MIVEKMHGCGNDFCVIPYEENKDYKSLAIKICNRKTGVGSDGMIVVKSNPLEMLFYNQDGSMAPMCGNGIRCFSKYAYEHKLFRGKLFDCITGAGVLHLEVTQDDPFMVKVNMGKPNFSNAMIHASDCMNCFDRIISIDDLEIPIYSFFMGTVHTVIFVDSFDDRVLQYADEICNYRLFSKKTNVNFVKVIDKSTLEVRTYERGVGWTLACGTGCCSALVTTAKLGYTKPKARVLLELGYLDIEIDKNGNVFMTGPAVSVFTCEYKED